MSFKIIPGFCDEIYCLESSPLNLVFEGFQYLVGFGRRILHSMLKIFIFEDNDEGFTLHFDGKFNFNEELKTVEYVGGRSHHWPVQPKELTMVDLNNIILQVVDGDMSDVLSIHFKKSRVNVDDGLHLVENDEDLEELVVDWVLDRRIEVYVETDGDDEDGEDDEEFLDDVSFCSEGGDDEFTEMINNAKSYTVDTVIEEIRQRGANDEQNESDSNFSVDTNYMEDPDLNWSMSDNDECVNNNAAGNGSDSDGVPPMNVEGIRRDPNKVGHKLPQCEAKKRKDKEDADAVAAAVMESMGTVDARGQMMGTRETQTEEAVELNMTLNQMQTRKKKARVKGVRHAEEDIIDMTGYSTPLQSDPSPKKTRLFIGFSVLTKKRSPRKSKFGVPLRIQESETSGLGKDIWKYIQSRTWDDEQLRPPHGVNELPSQFRIANKLVRKRKP
ncbi:hypothetical protein ACFE04_005121 [Oxalis oulophora]